MPEYVQAISNDESILKNNGNKNSYYEMEILGREKLMKNVFVTCAKLNCFYL